MKLNRGINLGGFLSQCEHSEEHYDTFILKEDIERIASLGFDHVRLPIDYEVFEYDNGYVKKEGFDRVRNVIEWAKEYKLNIILDLHKAYGYDFNNAGDETKNNLFSSWELQGRFVTLWSRIISEYGEYDHVAFELLNEVVEKENAEAWNSLIRKTVKEIRKVAPTAPIIYGGIQWNSVKTLKLLDMPMDENIIFTFHFYEPLLFTHQKAHWVAAMDPDQTVYYPKDMGYFIKYSKKLGYQGEAVVLAKSENMGEEFITEMIEEAIVSAKNAGVTLYCGEFGVIDQAPIEDTLRWFKDVDKVFRKYDIGCAVWSYKEMDFGFVGEHYAPIRDELVKLWCEN